MQSLDLVAIVGAILLPVVTFLWSQNLSMKKEKKEQQEKQDSIIDDLYLSRNKAQESFARLHMRVDRVEHDQQKLESAVEVKLDRFSDKLEKIYELLIEEKLTGKGNPL